MILYYRIRYYIDKKKIKTKKSHLDVKKAETYVQSIWSMLEKYLCELMNACDHAFSIVEQLSCCRSHCLMKFSFSVVVWWLIEGFLFFFCFLHFFILTKQVWRNDVAMRCDRRARPSENVRSVVYSIILSFLYPPISFLFPSFSWDDGDIVWYAKMNLEDAWNRNCFEYSKKEEEEESDLFTVLNICSMSEKKEEVTIGHHTCILKVLISFFL